MPIITFQIPNWMIQSEEAYQSVMTDLVKFSECTAALIKEKGSAPDAEINKPDGVTISRKGFH